MTFIKKYYDGDATTGGGSVAPKQNPAVKFELISPKERDNLDLLELVCQLHSRALAYPSKHMHDAYIEARTELESRLSQSSVDKKDFVASEDGWISVEDRLPDCKKVFGEKKKINWVLGTDGKVQFVCVYTKGHELEYGDEDPSSEEYDLMEEQHGCLYLKPGWYELEETPRGEYDETWIERKPTHWMLLPPNPPLLKK